MRLFSATSAIYNTTIETETGSRTGSIRPQQLNSHRPENFLIQPQKDAEEISLNLKIFSLCLTAYVLDLNPATCNPPAPAGGLYFVSILSVLAVIAFNLREVEHK